MSDELTQRAWQENLLSSQHNIVFEYVRRTQKFNIKIDEVGRSLVLLFADMLWNLT